MVWIHLQAPPAAPPHLPVNTPVFIQLLREQSDEVAENTDILTAAFRLGKFWKIVSFLKQNLTVW